MRAIFNSLNFLSLASVLFLVSCAEIDRQAETEAKSEQKLVLKPASFSDLPGWRNDEAQLALDAFRKSCVRILKSDATKLAFKEAWAKTNADWQRACRNLPQGTVTSAQARSYFETNFTPVAATNNGDATGKFTGYFEASLRGSKTRGGAYQIPLRAKPDDLVMVDLGAFRDELKGQRIAGRVVGGHLKPYETRGEIEDGKLPPAQEKILLWVDSAADAFFLQIQGSGIVEMNDGSISRVGYDGQNGHPYYAIGKELVKRGHLKQEDVSMNSIKAFLASHPQEGREIMRLNKSYVFFKQTENNQEGPKGGEGVPLTPDRSLAIDRSLMPYGMPVYLVTEQLNINRLMVAQDTGGAIRGPVRGDIFFGHGERAEDLAGPMNSPGRYWFLLPK